MPRQKVTNQEFLARIAPLLADPSRTPTLREIAQATGLSEGGAYYKMKVLRISRRSRLVFEAEQAG